MLEFSANDLWDMGSSIACEKLGPEVANYAIFEINLNTVPSFLKMGFCIPAACTQNSIDIILNRIDPQF
jgi:hypothetical protein